MVKHAIHLHADFGTDLRSHLVFLAHRHEVAYINRLRDGIDEAIELLSHLPHVGAPELSREGPVRKLVLRRLPFLIWYAYDDEETGGEVWLLRLFHVRQDRPLGARRRR